MLRLNRRRHRGVLARVRADDRGGVSALVAVLLAGGVLLGMTAIVVDLGMIYAEREELQAGADAAALAVALDCAKGRPECSTAGVVDTARAMADSNARDGRSGVMVCGEDGDGPLARCPEPAGTNLATCLDLRTAGNGNYVEVRTTTRTASGGTLLPPTFAAAVVPEYQGSTVAACARVGWGVPRLGVGFTISACEWSAATDGGTRFAPAPPTDVAEADGFERVLMLRHPNGSPACPAGPAGWDRPGGFGWVLDLLGRCQADPLALTSLYLGDPGNDVPRDCDDLLSDARRGRTVLVVPVYDQVRTRFGVVTYELHGMAAFVVTGYRLSGGLRADSTVTGDPPCGPGDACVSGYFVETVVGGSGGVSGGLPYLGAVTVRTLG